MARKLPWERRLPAAAHRRSFSPGGARDGEEDSRGNEDGRQAKRSRADAVPRFRSPSTSPAPAPPPETYMIDGMDHDDQWRMVEDELLAVAREFTAHLHAAEYQRLKAQARRQTAAAAALPSIARPVGVEAKDGGDDDDEDDPPRRQTSLRSLMEGRGARKEASLLPLLARTAAGRRAVGRRAVGRRAVGQPAVAAPAPSVYEDEEDEDDLDGPPPPRTASVPEVRAAQPQPPEREEDDDETQDDVDDEETQGSVDDYDDDDLDLDTGQLLQTLRRRREREKAARGKQPGAGALGSS